MVEEGGGDGGDGVIKDDDDKSNNSNDEDDDDDDEDDKDKDDLDDDIDESSEDEDLRPELYSEEFDDAIHLSDTHLFRQILKANGTVFSLYIYHVFFIFSYMIVKRCDDCAVLLTLETFFLSLENNNNNNNSGETKNWHQ